MLSDATKRVDETKLKEFMGRVVNDLGATWSTALVIIGDKLGLYKAMADSRPVSAEELASRTGTTERYIREWLANQAAGGYIHSCTGHFQFTSVLNFIKDSTILATTYGSFFASFLFGYFIKSQEF
jgi:hypothetical protein